MIIVTKEFVEEEQLRHLLDELEHLNLNYRLLTMDNHYRIAVMDSQKNNGLDLTSYSFIERVFKTDDGSILTSRLFKPTNSVIRVNGIEIGNGKPIVIAGPCAVENRDQLIEIAKCISSYGAHFLRGGAYKPRSSPYSFQGLGEKGLEILKEAKQITGLPIVTEVMSVNLVDKVALYSDIIQIGSRNMQNFELLKEVGKSQKPVLLKRGMSASVKEFIMAAEYIMAYGNYNVILCERGIKTFETSTRSTLDISAVPILKRLTHLPVIVDPSHAAGVWWLVEPLSKAAVAAGADGLMIEVHNEPQVALSDGKQSLKLNKFNLLMKEII